MVSGEPAPTVTWGRNKGTVDDASKYKSRYDARNQEHILEVGRSIDCQTLTLSNYLSSCAVNSLFRTINDDADYEIDRHHFVINYTIYTEFFFVCLLTKSNFSIEIQ